MFFPPSALLIVRRPRRTQEGLASVFDVVPRFCARMRLLVLFVCHDGGGGGGGGVGEVVLLLVCFNISSGWKTKQRCGGFSASSASFFLCVVC